jgi:multidrug transporter EmrE-like cation transporter
VRTRAGRGGARGAQHARGRDPAHLLAAVATGLLGSAVPFLLYNTAIRDLNVSVAAVILNLIPVFGAALAVALLGNSLSPLQLVGAAAIVLAALGIDRSADHDDGPRSGEYAAPGLTDADAPRPTACAHAATVALLADRAG